MVKSPATEKAWEVLEEVKDPEIPVLSVVDMGIVRSIEDLPDGMKVTITPTYSGCPAMEVIENEIRQALQEQGFNNVSVRSVLHPAWTTDWMSESGKQKLLEYGISPPQHSTVDKSILTGEAKEVICPNCRSVNTRMQSQFGSTPCKALYICNDCLEPFDYFKCI
ncbi:MAG: phenylacetate-CoA oxygenase subunit PaaJ [Cryomorphaceae bacterium]|nr:MAG: phenylacetate-CoA oxygenase subunit PaaJ [Cryomorphaceae bacterium]